MTGDERLAKVAEVLAATVRSMGDDIERQTCAQIGADLADDLAPLLGEFRAEDEARGARRVAFNPAHPDFQRFLHRVTKRAHDDGATEVVAPVEAVVRDHFGYVPESFRAALAAGEPDAGAR